MKRVIPVLLIALAAIAAPMTGHAQTGGSAESAEYAFGRDDILGITVFGKPEFTGEVSVDFRGMIQVPLVGEVRAAGRSPSQLGEYLTERYQLLDPGITEVLVSVVEYKSRTITVVGEVRSPGPYGFVEIPGLWDVILTAGGPQADADLSRVQIMRGTPREGESASIVVNLSAGMDQANHGSLPQLYAQDKVFIPSAEDVPVGDQDFQVLGAVSSAGTYRISVATNVIEALSAAGGPTKDADLKSVFLTRSTPTGTKSWRVNLQDYIESAQTPNNLDLLAGDTVMVPERNSFLSSFASVSGLLIPFISLAVTFAWANNR